MISSKETVKEKVLISGKLTVNLLSQQVYYDGAQITLPELSYQLLVTLMNNWPNTMMQDELIFSVWGQTQVQNSTLSQRVKLLRQTLKAAHCDPAYIALVRGKGYRFAEIVSVETLCLEAKAHDKEQQSYDTAQHKIKSDGTSEHGRNSNPTNNAVDQSALQSHTSILYTQVSKLKSKHIVLAVLSLFLVIALLLLSSPPLKNVEQDNSNKTEGVYQRKILTIIPFDAVEGSKDKRSIDNSYLGSSFSQELLYTLTAVKGLKVIAYDPLTREQLRQLPATAIGQKLNVSYIVKGSIERIDQVFRVNVRLLSTKDNEVLLGNSYEVDYSKLPELKYDVATSISGYFQQTKDDISALRTKYNLVKPKAYDLYLKALDYSQGNSYRDNFNAKLLLEQAYGLFPSCPDITIAYANALNNDFSFGRSDKTVLIQASKLANKTIALYPERSYGYASLARNYLLLKSYEKAEKYFTLALQINRENIDALSGISHLQIINKEFNKAAKNIELVATLDPGSTRSLILSARLNFEIGAFNKSRDAYQSVIKVEPDNINALVGLSHLAIIEDKIDSANEYYLKAETYDSTSPKVKALKTRITLAEKQYQEAQLSNDKHL